MLGVAVVGSVAPSQQHQICIFYSYYLRTEEMGFFKEKTDWDIDSISV